MNLEKLREPLKIWEIDFRVQSVNNGKYATILAYKDARVDMNRLDEAVGPLLWKREHLNDNSNCVVSIYDQEIGQWVSKEDTGTESNTEQAKGLASDSFKRACFNWGIGRELYDYPFISIILNNDEFDNSNGRPRATYKFKLKKWTWAQQFNSEGKLIYLAAKDDSGRSRYSFGEYDRSLELYVSDGSIKAPNREVE